jgi:DNA polymerase (family 10)
MIRHARAATGRRWSARVARVGSPVGRARGDSIPILNAEIAERLERYADLIEIEGENPFRVRAYRNAAFSVVALTRPLAEMVEAGEDLAKLHGIGPAIARKIVELVRTGRLQALERLEAREGRELVDLLRIPGLGPKRVRALHQKLGVSSPQELAEAVREGRVSALPGFGPATERAILRAVSKQAPTQRRIPWLDAEPAAEALLDFLKGIPGAKRVSVAGSFRRCRETVGDLDLLVTQARGAQVLERFVEHEDIERVVSQGSTRATVLLRSGLQVDARAVPEASYGAALHYFTGSKAHNIAVRTLGVRRGLKLNEYGVFRGEERVAGRSEREVYAAVDLPYIEPELREDRGELAAAREGRLPRLVALGDVRGDLHVHTTASDGRSGLRQMAEAAQRLGYEYLAISDHSPSLRVARGLDPKRLRRQLREVERWNESQDGLVLLGSAEVEILEDGSLDLPDDLLAELDFAIGAVHSHFGLAAERQTERMLRAMDHPRLHALAHPTGRLIGKRDAYALDVERLFEGAAQRGCWLELNAQPQRLDLPDVFVQAAREHGVRIVVSSDAHSAGQLGFMRLGIAQARRGWLEKKDIVNTRSLALLRKLLRH